MLSQPLARIRHDGLRRSRSSSPEKVTNAFRLDGPLYLGRSGFLRCQLANILALTFVIWDNSSPLGLAEVALVDSGLSGTELMSIMCK